VGVFVGVGDGDLVALGLAVGEEGTVGLASTVGEGDGEGWAFFWEPMKKAPPPTTRTRIIKRGRSSLFIPLRSSLFGSGVSGAGTTCSSSTGQDDRGVWEKSQLSLTT
jgi:hypothetical protein